MFDDKSAPSSIHDDKVEISNLMFPESLTCLCHKGVEPDARTKILVINPKYCQIYRYFINRIFDRQRGKFRANF